MRSEIGPAIRAAVNVDAPQLPLSSIVERSCALSARARAARPRTSFALIAATVLIGILAVFTIDRLMVAVPAGSAARAPAPSPTVT